MAYFLKKYKEAPNKSDAQLDEGIFNAVRAENTPVDCTNIFVRFLKAFDSIPLWLYNKSR